ncbi:DNA repair exonuclease SbcCD ATPase subunit [Pedobacter steynii]|uniref:DNA repair exonuclease SbcCD ATPase subunit n=1 Tax=Pedobacter steynii TaxID=430522 RepID=A0A1G9LEM2_9SPHI|nr:AAA family ATPase [Pedobacter steynii]NQX38827.1 AAA family ATPase [Pedobacter steynii]SDL60449.1 DNA repair exonuclease SbcCD ATPase subunit [Pedobacter steynii]
MMTIEELIRQLEKYYQSIEPITDKVVKASRFYMDIPYQTFYFDLSGSITPENLGAYLKSTITDDYFAKPGAIQWNYYVVFLVEHEIEAEDRFAIESDLDFARKFVLHQEALADWLKRSYEVGNTSGSQIIDKSLAEIWEAKLGTHGLDFLVERSLPVSSGVEIIISGDFPETSDKSNNNDWVEDHDVHMGEIQELKTIRYREYPKSDAPFSFGKVNLINGANGHGKTSLLEAIEYFYTGDNFRSDGTVLKKDYQIGAKLAGEADYRVSKNDLTIFDQRDRVWYNSARGRSDTALVSNFNRFNFYNTDASFRLTLNKDELDVENAFRDLALGEEINQVKNHIEAYREELKDVWESKKQLRIDYLKDIDEAGDTLNQLARSRDGFSVLFAELTDLLSKSSVTIPSYNAESPNLEEIRQHLKEFNTHLKNLLRDVDWLSEVTLRTVTEEYKALNATYVAYKKINSEVEDMQTKKINAEAAKQLALQKINLLKSLRGYIKDGVTETDPEYKTYLELTDKKKNSFAAYFNMRKHYESRYAKLQLTIPEYIDRSQFQQRDLKSSQTVARISTARAREHLAEVQKITSTISDCGIEYLKIEPDACICPLCKTNFESFEKLKGSIELDFKLLNERENFVNILKEEQKIDRELQDLSYDFDRILSLKSTAGWREYSLDLQTDTIAHIIQVIYDRIGEELSESESSIKKINKFIQWGERRKSDLFQLGMVLRQLKAYFSAEITESAEEIENTILQLEKDVRDFNEEIGKHTLEIYSLSAQRYGVLDEFVPIESGKYDYIEKLLFERTESLNHYAENIIHYKYIVYDPYRHALDVSGETEHLYELVDQLFYDLTLNERSTSLSQQAMETIEDRNGLLKLLMSEIDRLENALGVIDSLYKQYSEEDYFNNFLLANKEQIKAIFLTIHAPKEFTDILISEGKIRLLKTNGEISDLFTISTGQRSALALAVFLTLNSKVKKGPQLIIFDDPLAFTDDLNILSFLDYLREIISSSSGGKQLFFATANDNLAFLFKKKFDMFKDGCKDIVLKR